MSYSSSSYESSAESLNSDRSDSIHSDDSREMAWHLENILDDEGRPNNNNRHHHLRQVIQAEVMVIFFNLAIIELLYIYINCLQSYRLIRMMIWTWINLI